jgi:hypothetical protein
MRTIVNGVLAEEPTHLDTADELVRVFHVIG